MKTKIRTLVVTKNTHLNDMLINEDYFNELEIDNNDINAVDNDESVITYSTPDEFTRHMKSLYTSSLVMLKDKQNITLQQLYELVTELKKRMSYIFNIYNIEYSAEFAVTTKTLKKDIDYTHGLPGEPKLYNYKGIVIITGNDFSETDDLVCYNTNIQVYINYPVFKPRQVVSFIKNIMQIAFHNKQICLIKLQKNKSYLSLSNTDYKITFGKYSNIMLKKYDPVYFIEYFDFFFGKNSTNEIIKQQSRYKEVVQGSGIYKDDEGDIYTHSPR